MSYLPEHDLEAFGRECLGSQELPTVDMRYRELGLRYQASLGYLSLGVAYCPDEDAKSPTEQVLKEHLNGSVPFRETVEQMQKVQAPSAVWWFRFGLLFEAGGVILGPPYRFGGISTLDVPSGGVPRNRMFSVDAYDAN